MDLKFTFFVLVLQIVLTFSSAEEAKEPQLENFAVAATKFSSELYQVMRVEC